MLLVNLHGLTLDVDITYAQSEPSTPHTNGHSELCWNCKSGTDEIGENISTNVLDLICNEYINEIERAIWAQIEGERT